MLESAKPVLVDTSPRTVSIWVWLWLSCPWNLCTQTCVGKLVKDPKKRRVLLDTVKWQNTLHLGISCQDQRPGFRTFQRVANGSEQLHWQKSENSKERRWWRIHLQELPSSSEDLWDLSWTDDSQESGAKWSSRHLTECWWKQAEQCFWMPNYRKASGLKQSPQQLSCSTEV